MSIAGGELLAQRVEQVYDALGIGADVRFVVIPVLLESEAVNS